jgi:hypothetical protein
MSHRICPYLLGSPCTFAGFSCISVNLLDSPMLDVLYLPESLSFPVLLHDLLINVCIPLDLPGPSHFFSGFSCISREYAYISHGSASTLDLYLPQTSFYSSCISLYLPVTPFMFLYLHVRPQKLLRYPMNLLVSAIGPLYLPWMSYARFSCIFLDFHIPPQDLLCIPRIFLYLLWISLYLPVTPFIFLDLHVPPQDLLLCPMNLLVSLIEPLYLL